MRPPARVSIANRTAMVTRVQPWKTYGWKIQRQKIEGRKPYLQAKKTPPSDLPRCISRVFSYLSSFFPRLRRCSIWTSRTRSFGWSNLWNSQSKSHVHSIHAKPSHSEATSTTHTPTTVSQKATYFDEFVALAKVGMRICVILHVDVDTRLMGTYKRTYKTTVGNHPTHIRIHTYIHTYIHVLRLAKLSNANLGRKSLKAMLKLLPVLKLIKVCRYVCVCVCVYVCT